MERGVDDGEPRLVFLDGRIDLVAVRQCAQRGQRGVLAAVRQRAQRGQRGAAGRGARREAADRAGGADQRGEQEQDGRGPQEAAALAARLLREPVEASSTILEHNILKI